ncbi:DUF998 domain-containing protein [Polymorphospora lycopeni]|uniref:DUF998 domain-containing protein n=1 Tax=Polymorphospora lycopeni TaxID=3140240 RepID=A0ABV5CZ10_9ACTN
MRAVPWWAIASSAAAPVLLIGGWTVAAGRQQGYDQTTGTISALAALGATDRWIMAVALAGLGICHLVTACGLRPVPAAGRGVLALGGIATVLVATFPQPAAGTSTAHGVAAAVAFGALGLWPALGFRRDTPRPPTLRPAVAVTAAVVLLALVGWFVASLGGSGYAGLAERVAAGAQTLWPLAVVLDSRRSRPVVRTTKSRGSA